mmetsp:Transcript_30734/g.60415  ORF Transcript_30734/g.60415 Transcript_30734/m.60415 type:complete len:229 (+) Transcript_30734:67-753(+)
MEPPPAAVSGGTAAPATASAAAKPVSKKGFKLVLLGDASVGKSSIFMRFLQNKFSEGIETTVGAAFNTKTIESKGRQVKFEIWDTAGQERFRSLAPMYYRGASCAIVVYDQTNSVTYERAQEWVRQVTQTSTNPNIVIALAANKADLVDQRQVDIEAAQAFADREGLLLMETSALSGSNVARLFELIAEHLPDEPFVPEHRGIVVAQTPNLGKTAESTAPKKACCQSS